MGFAGEATVYLRPARTTSRPTLYGATSPDFRHQITPLLIVCDVVSPLFFVLVRPRRPGTEKWRREFLPLGLFLVKSRTQPPRSHQRHADRSRRNEILGPKLQTPVIIPRRRIQCKCVRRRGKWARTASERGSERGDLDFFPTPSRSISTRLHRRSLFVVPREEVEEAMVEEAYLPYLLF